MLPGLSRPCGWHYSRTACLERLSCTWKVWGPPWCSKEHGFQVWNSLVIVSAYVSTPIPVTYCWASWWTHLSTWTYLTLRVGKELQLCVYVYVCGGGGGGNRGRELWGLSMVLLGVQLCIMVSSWHWCPSLSWMLAVWLGQVATEGTASGFQYSGTQDSAVCEWLCRIKMQIMYREGLQTKDFLDDTVFKGRHHSRNQGSTKMIKNRLSFY